MKIEEKETKPRYGIVSFERRRYRRFIVRLPIEYYQVNSRINQTGQTLNASEGGLEVLFSEQIEIGQHLRAKLFFSSGPELNAIKILVEVVWMNDHLAEGERYYRSGVKFIEISPEDSDKLEKFLSSLSQ